MEVKLACGSIVMISQGSAVKRVQPIVGSESFLKTSSEKRVV